jgi:glutathione S-transferase
VGTPLADALDLARGRVYVRPMSDDALVLHAETMWASPYVFSSWVALHEKGLRFDVREIALVDLENRSRAYREQTLTAKVPALEHGDFVVAESSAIAEYLEDAFPPPRHPRVLPAEPRPRARARQLMAWLRSDLGVLRTERPTVTMFFAPATVPLSPAGETAAAELLRVAEYLIPRDGGPLFGAWSLPDAELAFMLHRLILNGHEMPARVRSWAEREWQRPSAQGFIRHARPAACPERYWDMPANAGVARPWSTARR